MWGWPSKQKCSVRNKSFKYWNRELSVNWDIVSGGHLNYKDDFVPFVICWRKYQNSCYFVFGSDFLALHGNLKAAQKIGNSIARKNGSLDRKSSACKSLSQWWTLVRHSQSWEIVLWTLLAAGICHCNRSHSRILKRSSADVGEINLTFRYFQHFKSRNLVGPQRIIADKFALFCVNRSTVYINTELRMLWYSVMRTAYSYYGPSYSTLKSTSAGLRAPGHLYHERRVSATHQRKMDQANNPD
jgi:hypothetical protein